MIDWIWLVPVFPLLGFLLISLGGKQLPKQAAGFIGSATVLASFLISLGTFFATASGAHDCHALSVDPRG